MPGEPPAPSSPAALLRGLRNRLFGDRGERAAVAVLRRAGLKIVARNVRNAGGEIDVLARDGETLVFVEVKTRKSSRAGSPVEAVTHDKRTRLTRAALVELKRRGRLGWPCRFDVVAITWPEGASDPEVVHYRHAFEATGVTSAFS